VQGTQKDRQLPPGLADIARRKPRRYLLLIPGIAVLAGVLFLLWLQKATRTPEVRQKQWTTIAQSVNQTEAASQGSPRQPVEAKRGLVVEVKDIRKEQPQTPQARSVSKEVTTSPMESSTKREPESSPAEVKEPEKPTQGPPSSKPEGIVAQPPPPAPGLEHLWTARVMESRGDYRGAIREYLEYLRGERDPKVIHKVATLYLKVGALEEAERYFREAMALDPGDPGIRTNYAVLLAKRGRTEKAEALLREVLEGEPTNIYALFNLALLMEKAGRWNEARELYQKLSSLGDPSGQEGLRRLGFTGSSSSGQP